MGLKNTYQTRKRFTKVPVSKTGMWYQDGDVVVPSNQITMKGPNGEPDYFNFPILGTGMQSGQTQVMYPGREYSFPNDNSVYERKMQSGGNIDPEFMFKNKYNTELTPSEETDFSKWAAEESQRQGRDILNDMGAYDVKGFWKSGDYKKMDSDNHGTDTWKKPNHPTFSNQSRYHGADGWYGGNWTDKGGYQPSKQTLETYGPDYYDWMFKSEPGRIEHLDMSRYKSGLNTPSPFVYQKGGATPTYQDSLALYNYNQLQRRLENKSDIYKPSLTESILGNYSKLTPQGKKDQNALRAEALKILKNNPNIKPGLYNIPKGLTRSSISDYDAAEGSYDLYHPGIKPQGAWFGIATNNDYSNVKPTSLQKEIPYPNQPIGTGMKRSISKNTNPIQKSTPTPIYVSDKNDPRLKSYNDSLSLNQKFPLPPKGYKVYPYESQDTVGVVIGQDVNGNNIIEYRKDVPSKIEPIGYTKHKANQSGKTFNKNKGVYEEFVESQRPIYKKPVQPVIYADPKIVAKQQQLIDAGYNIGTADGIWGPKSQQAWDQMNIPKQSNVNASFSTPTMTVRGITEENADILKKQYEDEFGTNFKSEDNIFNNLQKSLGRRPTVTEYNRAIQQYNLSNRSMKQGGWLNRYQDGGETSTEDNPVRMSSVDIQAPQRSWFDKNIEAPLRRWGRSYAQRISDATGGSEWYKQPNSVASAFFSTGPGFALEAPQLSATYAATGKVQRPSEAMNIENPYLAVGTDIVLDPIGGPALAKGLVKGLPAAARFATTKTPLRNAWKLNPKAYQYNLPENTMWRGLGQEGMEDAVSSGLFRAKQNVIPEYYPGTKLQINKSFGTNPYFTPKFKTAATYGDNYLAEVPRDAANWSQRYKRSDWSQVADRPIPISEGRILQKDWLKGYKPVEIPSSSQSFKSEIDWAKWNPETPNYPELINEYNTIEESTKKAGTWMKNPDGSPFQGTPEQFIQQQSSYFKKAFGNSKLVNPDGSPTFQYHGGKKGYEKFLTPQDKGYIKRDSYTGDQGIYFTPSKSRAKSYSRNTPKNEREIYQTYINMENPYSGRIKGAYGKDQIINEQYEDLLRNDYDGIIDKNLFPYHRQTIVFDPKRIKSAVGNVGFFDMTNPNIYKAVAPVGASLGVGASQLQQKKYGGLKMSYLKTKRFK